MSTYKDYFDSITPEKDNKKFADSIINAEKPKMKISPKKIAASVIAAATAAAVTVTGYASGWDYGAVFNQIFGDNSKNIQENILDEGTVVENSINNLDITLTAAAADKHGIFLVLDISSNDGSVLYDSENARYTFEDKYFVTVDSDSTDFDNLELGLSIDYIKSEKNLLTMTINGGTGNDMSNETLRVRVIEKNNHSNYWTAVVKVDSDVDEVTYSNIPEFTAEVNHRDTYTHETQTKYMQTKFTEITVSPISMIIKGEIPFYIEWGSGYDTSYLVTGDGHKVYFRSGGSIGGVASDEEYMESFYWTLSEPIKPENLKAIVINGVEVPLK